MMVWIVIAVAGAALLAVGVGMWAAPAGVAVAGAESIGAAYLGAYARVRRDGLEIERR